MKKTIEIVIPEGYEQCGTVGSLYSTPEDQLQNIYRQEIVYKRIQVKKEFNWYIDEYCKILRLKEIKFSNLNIQYLFRNDEYSEIPFEFRIGLFKFICGEMNIKHTHALCSLEYGFNLALINCDRDKLKQLYNIIPIKFINSLK